MNLKQWIILHKPSAHAVAIIIIGADTLWATNDEFRAALLAAYTVTPPWLHWLVTGILLPALAYWRTQRTAVAVVEAQPGETGTAAAVAKVQPGR